MSDRLSRLAPLTGVIFAVVVVVSIFFGRRNAQRGRKPREGDRVLRKPPLGS